MPAAAIPCAAGALLALQAIACLGRCHGHRAGRRLGHFQRGRWQDYRPVRGSRLRSPLRRLTPTGGASLPASPRAASSAARPDDLRGHPFPWAGTLAPPRLSALEGGLRTMLPGEKFRPTYVPGLVFRCLIPPRASRARTAVTLTFAGSRRRVRHAVPPGLHPTAPARGAPVLLDCGARRLPALRKCGSRPGPYRRRVSCANCRGPFRRLTS